MAQPGSRSIQQDLAIRATLALRPLIREPIDSDIASHRRAQRARVACAFRAGFKAACAPNPMTLTVTRKNQSGHPISA
jgi:hypothetical protein